MRPAVVESQNRESSALAAHAFGEEAGATGTVNVRLRVEPDKVQLEVVDDGYGIPDTVDWKDTDSLGLRLVRLFGKQLGASVEVSEVTPGAERPGTRVCLERPTGELVEALPRELA